MATFIACGAATPIQAISLAALCGFLGAVVTGSAVSNTVAAVVALPLQISLLKVLWAAMIGAVIWNLLTWKLGFPSSSTHALVGGLIGAVWVSHGPNFILWGWKELLSPNHHVIGISKIVLSLIISPILGFFVALLLQKISHLVLRNANFKLNTSINRIQWVMAGLLAFSHGGNDTQKIVGIISMALAASSYPFGQIDPVWIRACGGLVMFAGTLLGGWSIMKTVGRGIYTIRPIHSLNSQLSAGASILMATFLGAPVSTTHVVVGSVVGVGSADEYRMVNWKIGQEIIVAWTVTMPASAMVAAGLYFLFR